jgi:hypothetical protein
VGALSLLLAGVVTISEGDGVPGEVAERARKVVERAMEGVHAEVRLELYRTRREMETAVRKVTPTAPTREFTAFYHFDRRTLFAYMAPRPDAALFKDRLPGILLGALVHEVQHARGDLTHDCYQRRTWHRIEGEADRDAVRYLRTVGLPGAGAWELLWESRVERAREAGLFLDDAKFRSTDPTLLSGPQRATWYAQAYALARGERRSPPLPWVVWDGTAEPLGGGYRVIAREGETAMLVRRGKGPLDVTVTPLAVGRGRVELLFDFESGADHAKVVFSRDGGVRAMWCRGGQWQSDPERPAPSLLPGRSVRLSISDGVVRVNGSAVLHVQEGEGRKGVGVFDGAVDFKPTRAS